MDYWTEKYLGTDLALIKEGGNFRLFLTAYHYVEPLGNIVHIENGIGEIPHFASVEEANLAVTAYVLLRASHQQENRP